MAVNRTADRTVEALQDSLRTFVFRVVPSKPVSRYPESSPGVSVKWDADYKRSSTATVLRRRPRSAGAAADQHGVVDDQAAGAQIGAGGRGIGGIIQAGKARDIFRETIHVGPPLAMSGELPSICC